MKANVRKAYEELRKLNIAVQGDTEWDTEGNYHFWIWCEGITDETQDHLDYYSLYWGSTQINEILKKHELYFEWQNPAQANIYSL